MLLRTLLGQVNYTQVMVKSYNFSIRTSYLLSKVSRYLQNMNITESLIGSTYIIETKSIIVETKGYPTTRVFKSNQNTSSKSDTMGAVTSGRIMISSLNKGLRKAEIFKQLLVSWIRVYFKRTPFAKGPFSVTKMILWFISMYERLEK